jgi:hypothetical protein
VSAAEASSTIGLRLIFPNSSRIVTNAYISVQKLPTVAVNQPLTAKLSFSAAASPPRTTSNRRSACRPCKGA